MKTTKIASIILVGLSLVTMAACSLNLTLPKYDYKKACDNIGFQETTEYNSSQWNRNSRTGSYIQTTNHDEIVQIMTDVEMLGNIDDVKTLFYAEKRMNPKYDYYRILSFTFDNEDDANTMFEYYYDHLSDMYNTHQFADEKAFTDKNYFKYCSRSDNYDLFREKGNTVTIILTHSISNADMFNSFISFYKEIDREFPFKFKEGYSDYEGDTLLGETEPYFD